MSQLRDSRWPEAATTRRLDGQRLETGLLESSILSYREEAGTMMEIRAGSGGSTDPRLSQRAKAVTGRDVTAAHMSQERGMCGISWFTRGPCFCLP